MPTNNNNYQINQIIKNILYLYSDLLLKSIYYLNLNLIIIHLILYIIYYNFHFINYLLFNK